MFEIRKGEFEEDSGEEIEEKISLHENKESTGSATKANKKTKKADELWADFKKDVDAPKRPGPKNSVTMVTTRKTNQSQEKPEPVKVQLNLKMKIELKWLNDPRTYISENGLVYRGML